MPKLPRVTVWNEFYHERENPEIGKLYPDGIHGTLARHLQEKGSTFTLPLSMSRTMAYLTIYFRKQMS